MAQTREPNYLAILSYAKVDATGNGVHTCVIIGARGEFHLETWPESRKPTKTNAKIRVGTIPIDMFQQLKYLLTSNEVVDLGDIDPVETIDIRREGEIFTLRVDRFPKVQEFSLTNPDGRAPLPRSVQGMVTYLLQLKEGGGTEVEQAKAQPNRCNFLEGPPDFMPQLRDRTGN